MQLREMRPYQLQDAVSRGVPLLVPAGCIECHGPHMALGHDTIVVEEVCRRVAEHVECVIAPSFDYGPTGYAVSGPEMGTIDPDVEAFGRFVRSVVLAFCEMGFRTIVVIIQHQGMEGPLALAFRKAAAELAFERAAQQRGRGWWGARPLTEAESGEVWARVHVRPMVLPSACPPAGGDHAGYYETSMLLAVRPELVEQSRLDETAPWYCQMGEARSSATASAAAGEEMLEAMVRAWAEELRQLG